MADAQRLTFLFTAVTSPNLVSLQKRSSSPNLQHFFSDTVKFYEEFLIARDGGYKLLMVPPGSSGEPRESYEIDDKEEPGKHTPRGFVTITTDLTQINAVSARGGFVDSRNMLTKAFILRERVIDAIENGWRVGFYKDGDDKVTFQSPKRFSPMDNPGPVTLQ